MLENNIVFLEVDPEDTQKVTSTFPEAQINSSILSEEEIIQKYQDAEVLCTFIYSRITAKVMARLPHLKLIITRSVGYDHIDIAAATQKGIIVCNVPDYGAHVIAEHVFALLLSSVRFVREGDERVEKYHYEFEGFRGMALKNKTLGVIGTGKIGLHVARIATLGFQMNVLAYDPYPNEFAAREIDFEYVPLKKIWQKSDVISLHVPLIEQTKHLINCNTIAQMKDGVVLINTARGGIIDTSALVTGLTSGKISHAAVDVLEHEHHPEQDKHLIDLPNVITTPHIAFYADDSVKKMYSEAIKSIREFQNEEKLRDQVN